MINTAELIEMVGREDNQFLDRNRVSGRQNLSDLFVLGKKLTDFWILADID